MIENAFKAIVELHPDYHLDIQTFIAEDPVKLVRVNRLVQLLSTLDRPKVLQVSHEAGGGVKQHVEELSEALQANTYNLILKPRKGAGAVSLYMGTFPAQTSWSSIFRKSFRSWLPCSKAAVSDSSISITLLD
ncbi:hypothetical protein V5O39_02350 [Pseudomonas parakoreensis]